MEVNDPKMGILDAYLASAGSGKTYTLARRVIDMLVREPESYRNILAVTFTRKATLEMKERIVRDLYEIATGRDKDGALTKAHCEMSGYAPVVVRANCLKALENILSDLDNFNISTIDSFVQRVVRSFAYEYKLPSNYGVQIDNQPIIESAIDSMMQTLGEKGKEKLRKYLTDYLKQKLQNGERNDIESQLRELGETLLSEKSTMLEPFRSFGIEGISRLQKELNDKIEKARETIYNAFKELNETVDADLLYGRRSVQNALKSLPANYCRRKSNGGFDEWMKKCIELLGKDAETAARSNIKKNHEDLLENILHLFAVAQPELKGLNTNIEAIKQISTFGIIPDLAYHIQEVQGLLNKRTLNTAADLLNELVKNCDVPFIYEKSGARYEHLLIDEFQDTSHLQYENFKPLLHNSLDCNNNCLVVGDVKQSIYRFREGDWQLLAHQIEEDFGDCLRRQNLSNNYRSRAEIVTFNNAVFGVLPEILDGRLNLLDKERGERETLQNIYKNQAQNAIKGKGGYVNIRLMKTDKAQAWLQVIQECIEFINDMHNNHGWAYSDFCILTNTNYEIENLVEVLSADAVKIPTMTDSALQVMRASTTRAITDALRFINRGENTRLLSVIQVMTNADIANMLVNWEALESEWTERLNALRGLDLMETIYELVNMMPEEVKQVEKPYIEAFMQQTYDALSEGIANQTEFLDKVDQEGGKWTIESIPDIDAVELMTIHRSKGLERKIVLIPFVETIRDTGQRKNKIWCNANNIDPEINELQGLKIPIDESKNLNGTAFAEEYKDEQEQKYIDILNRVYVAFTRPKEILKVWMNYTLTKSEEKNKGKEKKQEEEFKPLKVGRVMADSLSMICDKINEANDEQKAEVQSQTVERIDLENIDILTDDDGNEELAPEASATDEIDTIDVLELTYGTLSNKENKAERNEAVLDENNILSNSEIAMPQFILPTQVHGMRSTSQDELSDHRQEMTTYGLAMHSIMEHIATGDEIHNAVEKIVGRGMLPPDVAQREEEKLTKCLRDNATVSEWFGTNVEHVWNEATILEPDVKMRPDRVIRTPDGRTVVVDYKFGNAYGPMTRRKYHKQIKRYMEHLSRAGHKNIEGYLWYYGLGKIEKIASNGRVTELN